MTISIRSVMFAAVLLGVPMLVACNDANHDITATVSPTVTTMLSKEALAAKKFVGDYRTDHAKLAHGREDQEIVDDGDDTCAIFEESGGKRADVIGEVSERFTANGVRPNDETAIQIMTLVVRDLCPDRAANLAEALSVE